MVVKLADNILSPLGEGTARNYGAVKAGESALRLYPKYAGVAEPFVASLFEEREAEEGYTFFETIAIRSAAAAIAEAGIDPASDRVLFILSTTKGNVDMLGKTGAPADSGRVRLGAAAEAIAHRFDNRNMPLVVSNACTSGLCAQIVAMRLLERGDCDYAVVIGAEVQSPFIISGFQSFKALSPEPCKPFDATRQGLNLGEAAATVVLGRSEDSHRRTAEMWHYVAGAIRNDANHISGPSRTGEGSYQALRQVMQHGTPDELAFVSTHGTATPYNDEMEAIAIGRAGLESVPVNSLKGFFGHTMGAAGVLESILSMSAVEDHTILPTRGYETCGVSVPLRLSNTILTTEKKAFVKMLSGFGGCNAAMFFRKEGCA